MGLLVDTVRNIQNESVLVSDTATYTASAAQDWTDAVTKSVTLAKASAVVVQFLGDGPSNPSNPTTICAFRCTVDGAPIITKHYQTTYTVYEAVTMGCILYLAAGTYTFAFQIAIYNYGANNINIKNVYIGTVDFEDDQYDNADSGNTAITAGATSTLATITVTTPATRKLLVGDINKYTCLIQVVANENNVRGAICKNAGASDTANRLNVQLFIDDVQVNWDTAGDDTALDATTNPSYGEGAYGTSAAALSANQAHTVKVKVKNTYATDKTGRVYLRVATCPWFFGTSTYLGNPVNLNFPLGSTLYAIAEPLFLNNSKSMYLGRKRAITFGAAVDYFSSSTGTGRTAMSYTFDYVDPKICWLLLASIGVAITFIGVDTR